MTKDLIIEISADEMENMFKKEHVMDDVIDRAHKKAGALKPDVTTSKGRAEIKSLAAGVTRLKTALDEAGKEEKEDAQKIVDRIDKLRRKARNELDGLKISTRQPLTDYEDEQERLDNEVIADLDALTRMQQIPIWSDLTKLDELRDELTAIRKRNDWRGKQEQADILIDAVESAISNARDMLEKQLQERKEREEQEAREREERQRQQARQREIEAENQKLRDEQAKKDAEIARINAEREQEQIRAQEAAVEQQRAHAAKLAEIEAEKEAEKLREADQAHAQSVKDEIIDDLLEVFVGDEKKEDFADLIYTAIFNGSIRNVRIVD